MSTVAGFGRDFTLDAYRRLIQGAGAFGAATAPMAEWQPVPGAICLRHDIDRIPGRALAMARLEAALGQRATYFVRMKPHVFSPSLVETLSGLGHEVGYHYEDLPDAGGDFVRAWDGFRRNLDMLRRFAAVSSIAMHGRPFSRWDSRDLWHRYDYRALGVRCEAYLDIDWSRTCYFTDTGRGWNAASNVRDRPAGVLRPSPCLPTTESLLAFLASGGTPAVVSSHPERWTGTVAGWLAVWATDAATNVAKKAIALRRDLSR